MRTVVWSVLLLCLLAAACAPAAPPGPAPAPVERLRAEFSANPDLATLPLSLALEELEAQGTQVERIAFGDISAAVAAMALGDLDMAVSGNLAAWSAVGEGAPIVSVLERSANTWLVIASSEVQACADLQGRRVGLNSSTAVATAMLDAYIAENCPGVEYERLVIASANDRVAGLLSGDLDAATQLIENLVRLEAQAPGRFHALTVFAEEFPQLILSTYIVRRDLIAERPEAARSLVKAMLLQRRRIQDPQVLYAETARYLEVDADLARQMGDMFLARNVWAVNGLLTQELVQANLDFLQRNAGLPPDLTPGDVADPDVLEAVLSEIGRQ